LLFGKNYPNNPTMLDGETRYPIEFNPFAVDECGCHHYNNRIPAGEPAPQEFIDACKEIGGMRPELISSLEEERKNFDKLTPFERHGINEICERRTKFSNCSPGIGSRKGDV
jgi:hypothetical protein